MTIVPKSKSGYKKIKWLFGKEIRIPNEWKVKKLNELGDIITGSTPPTSIPEHYGDDYLWASPTDLENTKFIKNTQSKLSNKGFNISRAIPKNSILVVCIASIGKIGIASKTMTSNQQINSIVCNLEHPEFVYYSLLKNNTLIKNMANRTVVPILNKTDFGTIRITLPCNYDEQQKIASILSGVDANIEATQKVIDKTELLKKGLMQQLLTKGIGHTKFKKTKFGKIPKNWNIAFFDKFVKIISGDYFPFTAFVEKGIPVLKIDNVMYGEIDWTKTTYLPQKHFKMKNLIMLKEDDIVLALNRPLTNCKIKIAKLRKKDVPSILYQRVGKFEFHTKHLINKNYFFIFLNSHIFKSILERILVGSDQPYVKTTELLKQKFSHPINIIEQEQIASILSGVDAIGITLLFRFQVCLRMMVARCMLVLCL